MFGKLLSKVIKVVTVPIDIAEVALDMTMGNDGTRRELKDDMPCVSNLRDKICDAVEEIDD